MFWQQSGEDFDRSDMRDQHQVVADRWDRVTLMSKAEEGRRKLKARSRVFPCLCVGALVKGLDKKVPER